LSQASLPVLSVVLIVVGPTVLGVVEPLQSFESDFQRVSLSDLGHPLEQQQLEGLLKDKVSHFVDATKHLFWQVSKSLLKSQLFDKASRQMKLSYNLRLKLEF